MLASAGLAFNEGKAERAKQILAKVEELEPDSVELWELRARFEESLGNNDLAIKYYNRVLKYTPDRIHTKIYLTNLLVSMKRVSDAIEIIEPLYNKDSFNPDLSYAFAIALLRAGRANEAKLVLTEANAALNAIPDDVKEKLPNLQIISALAAYHSGEYEIAIKYAGAALERFPHQVNLRVILTESYLKLGQTQEALEAIAVLPLTQPLPLSTLALYSHTLLLNGKYSEANAILERLSMEAPDSEKILSNLGISQLALGEGDEAVSTLERAMDAESNSGRAGYILAMSYLNQGRYRQAELTAKKILDTLPGNPIPYNLLSLAYVGKGDFEEAERQINEALNLAPNYLHANLTAAKIDLLTGKSENAETRLKSILSRSPQSTQVMAALANLAEINGDEEGAISWLEKARAVNRTEIELSLRLLHMYSEKERYEESLNLGELLTEENPNDLRVYLAYAQVQIAAGKPGYARSTLRKTLHFRDLSPMSLVTIAQWQMRAGDTSGAILSLNDAVNTYPEYGPAMAELLKLEARLGNFPRAHELVDKLVKNNSNDYSALVLRAYVFQSDNKLSEARNALEKAMLLRPNGHLAVQLFHVLSTLGDISNAVNLLEEWSKKEPDNLLVKNNLAIGYERLGHLSSARDTYVELTERYPNEASFRNNLALIYLKLDDSRAVDEAKIALSLSPQNPAFMDTYGWTLTQNNKPEEGIKFLRDAYSRNSKQPSLRYHLAKTLSLLGQVDQASDILKDLLAENPDFKEYSQAKSLFTQLN